MKDLNWKINLFFLRKVRILKNRTKLTKRKKVLIWSPGKNPTTHTIAVGGSGECIQLTISAIKSKV